MYTKFAVFLLYIIKSTNLFFLYFLGFENFKFRIKKSKKIANFENTLSTQRVNRVRIEIFCIPKLSLRSKATQNNMIWANTFFSYMSLTRCVLMTHICVTITQIRGLVTFLKNFSKKIDFFIRNLNDVHKICSISSLYH